MIFRYLLSFCVLMSIVSGCRNNNLSTPKEATPTPIPTVAHPYVSQWGSNGAVNGLFGYIHGLASDSGGNIYAADYGNNRIQKFGPDGTYSTQWASTYAFGVAVGPGDNVYVTDWANNIIRKYGSSGGFILQWGTFGAYYDGTHQGYFQDACAIAADGSGNIFVTDWGNDRIQKFDSSGGNISLWGSNGTADGKFNGPAGITTDSSGNVYVADSGNDRVQKFSGNGAYITQWGGSGSGNGQFNFPAPIGVIGMAVDSNGNIYVADSGNSRVQVFTDTGTYITQFGGNGMDNGKFYYGPSGITVGQGNYVYAADLMDYRVEKFGP